MDNWDEWGSGEKKSFEPLPPGQYVVRLDSCSMSFNEKGARTELTLIVAEGPHAGRYVWESWPHAANFRWLARMVWEAFGFTHPPAGEVMEQRFGSIAQGVTDCAGKHVRITTDLKTSTYNGETKKKVIVRRFQAITSQAQPQGANAYGGKPQTDAPQW